VEFLLIGAPFIGRAITPITYPFLMTKMDIERITYLSLGNMAILDIVEFFMASNTLVLIPLRVATGILFGLAISASVELATQSRSKNNCRNDDGRMGIRMDTGRTHIIPSGKNDTYSKLFFTSIFLSNQEI